MRKCNRTKIILLLSAACLLGFASVLLAGPPHGVKYTNHNLSSKGVGTFYSTNENEVCVFCHTPHNAVVGKKFLWNRPDSIATFMLYTSSPTLNYTKTGISLSSVSKMCMSCHDGGTALNSMANGNQATMMGNIDQLGDYYCNPDDPGCDPWIGIYPGANIGESLGGDGYGTSPVTPGGNLTNDHPVSFEYISARTNGDLNIKDVDPGGKSVGNGSLPLWLSDSGTKYMVECVTCHDPHINYTNQGGGNQLFKPFLRKSNESSSLCFTCHDK